MTFAAPEFYTTLRRFWGRTCANPRQILILSSGMGIANIMIASITEISLANIIGLTNQILTDLWLKKEIFSCEENCF
jgi:hypothetical protein